MTAEEVVFDTRASYSEQQVSSLTRTD